MAPEQFTSPAALDSRVDAWALGATLFEMVTGDPALPDEGGAGAVMHAVSWTNGGRL